MHTLLFLRHAAAELQTVSFWSTNAKSRSQTRHLFLKPASAQKSNLPSESRYALLRRIGDTAK